MDKEKALKTLDEEIKHCARMAASIKLEYTAKEFYLGMIQAYEFIRSKINNNVWDKEEK